MDGVGVFQARLEGLFRKDGRLWLGRPDGAEPVPVTARYLRPLTGRAEVVLLDEKHREVACVEGVQALQGEERALLEEELRSRYHLSVILRVRRIDVRFGTRYWDVETDRGPRSFALREPGKNVTWLDGMHLVLRDAVGNRFEIPDIGSLDAASRRWIGLAL